MEIHILPERGLWPGLSRRDAVAEAHEETARIVAEVFDNVATYGDKAVREYEKKFTGAVRESLRVAEDEIYEAAGMITAELKESIEKAAANIAAFHGAQKMHRVEVETVPGVVCSQRQVPIDTVGLYVPGGNSPLFSTILMLGVPARIAGCRRVVMATPADATGKVHPAILYAAQIAGVTDIYAMGGAQAIAPWLSVRKVCHVC
ncbi:MAG: histidinol dehydrogenase, partial [Muribaculaceae bacterium]|nr:histidinol dehydrogenase [Muribaculaceae bacterium]